MNLYEKKIWKKLTGSSVFRAIFYNGSLWEHWFFAFISYVIKPNQIETKYVNTRGQDLSNDIPHDLGNGQWPELDGFKFGFDP